MPTIIPASDDDSPESKEADLWGEFTEWLKQKE